MDHGPSTDWGHDAAHGYKTRLGLWMFACYCLFYASFVAINLYNPLLMEAPVALGLNLATVYGFALIIVALLLALIYSWLCGRKEEQLLAMQATDAVTAETTEAK